MEVSTSSITAADTVVITIIYLASLFMN
jgi:hypothetical protein